MKNKIEALDLSSVGAALKSIQSVLKPISETSQLEAEILVDEAIQKGRAYLWAFPEVHVTEAQQSVLRRWIERRAQGEPLAYLLGRKEFWGLSFHVDESVLIPRPDTETLVERAIDCLTDFADESQEVRMLDVGTGSGAIGLALVQTVPGLTCLATDISSPALQVARENVSKWGDGRCQLVRARWATCIAHNSIHLMVSNPPYIGSADPHLKQGDLRFEPNIALEGGETGLEPYEDLVQDGFRVIKPGGYLVMEHGFEQGEPIRQKMEKAGFVRVATDLDIAHHERVTWAMKPGSFKRS